MIEGLKPYAEYKESGQKWLGKVPAHWTTPRLKTVLRERDARSVDGKGLLLSLTRNRGLIARSDMTDKIHSARTLAGYKLYEPGEIVMNRMQAWSGMFGAGNKSGLVSPDYAVFKLLGGDLVTHLLARIKAPDLVSQFALESKGIGSGFNRLYSDKFGAIAISLPPPDEQAAIVRFLDHANRKIDGFIRAKRKLIGLLNEQKQAIIHRAVTRGLHPDVPLKPSGIPWLGDIPEHWVTMRLKNACKIRGGFAFKTEWFRADGVPVIRMSNLRRGTLDLTDAVRISENDCVAAFELKAGDILYGLSGSVGATGSLGNFAVVAAGDLPAQLNQRVARFRPDGRVLSVRFLVFLIHTSIFYDQVLADTTGTAQFNVSTNDVGKVTFSLPAVTEQTAICEWLDGALAKPNELITRTEREIALMQEYRTRLTADLVTGKLDVREAAAHLPAPPTDESPGSAADEPVEELEDEEVGT